MQRTAGRLAWLGGLFLLLAPFAMAQVGNLDGKVTGEDGNPVDGALIKIERTDIKANYQVKTKKDGKYFHAGLPLGTYNVSVEIGGKVADTTTGVRLRFMETTTVDFDLLKAKQRREAAQAAAAAGQLTEEQMKGMSKEEREAAQKAMEAQAKKIKANQDLNKFFNAGMEAKNAKQWDVAVENFTKAGEMAPKEPAVWENLADTYFQQAKTLTGDAKTAGMNKSADTYAKLIAIEPDKANLYNNYALALYAAGRTDDGRAALDKAIQLNPGNAGQYYYNLGVSLLNLGMAQNGEAACDAFAKGAALGGDFPEVYFQNGNCLMNKMTMTADGKAVPAPGTREAFEKYLQLAPNGPNAASAQQSLQVLNTVVDTKYQNPETQRKKVK